MKIDIMKKRGRVSRAGRLRAMATWIALGAASAVAAGAVAAGADAVALQSLASIQQAAEHAVLAEASTNDFIPTAEAQPLDPRLRLAHCARPLSAAVTGDGRIGAQTLVQVHCDDDARWSLYVTVKVASDCNVLVARRNLSASAELSTADFETAERRVPGILSNYVTDTAALAGQRLRRPLGAGEALELDMLTPANLIHRGQQVVLIARAGGVEVRMAAVALADGRAADHIRVQNVSSQRVVDAIVRSATVVEAPL